MNDDADRNAPDELTAGRDGTSAGAPAVLRWLPRLGIWSWSFVGLVAVDRHRGHGARGGQRNRPSADLRRRARGHLQAHWPAFLERHQFKPTIAAGVVVLGLIAVMTGVVVATSAASPTQTDEIGASVDAALDRAVDSLGVDQASLDAARAATEQAAPAIAGGFLTQIVSGVGTLVGLASGLILGALIAYYLLKDGTRLRRSVVTQFDPAFRDEIDDFIGNACRILRDYGRGRTVMSAVVALVIGLASLLLGLPLVFTIMVVNFIGGYIPYIGAFLGGGLAVLIALGDGGLRTAGVMLVVVLAANLVLENFVEPKVMGRTLDIHPLIVLVVTALGGLIGGIVGLILAVPATVIAANAFARLRSGGFIDKMADRAKPTVKRVLG